MLLSLNDPVNAVMSNCSSIPLPLFNQGDMHVSGCVLQFFAAWQV